MGKHLLKAIKTFLLIGALQSVWAQADELMIVEYVDWQPGSGVGIKIYNPTNAAINLSSYTLEVYYNGNTNPTGTYNLTGTIASKGTIITGNSPYCNTHCTSCDITNNNAGVNGNDVVVLKKGTTTIDMMGLIGYDPGSSGWRVDNTNNALKWHKVTRNSDNCIRYTSTSGSGANSWPNSSNTNVTGWTVSNFSCIAQGFTLNVSTATPEILTPTQDTTLCQGESFNFTTSGNFKWLRRNSSGETLLSNSASSVLINFNQSGSDTIIVQSESCGVTVEDTIVITIGAPFKVNLGSDTTICGNINLSLNPNITGADYTWQDNSTATLYNVTDTGWYWVVATRDNCTDTDSIRVDSKTTNTFSFGADTALCEGDSLVLTYNCSGCTYLWSDNETDDTLIAKQTGTYWLEADDGACQAIDTINITFNPLPQFNLGADTTLCNGDSILLNSPLANNRIWENNTTDSLRTIKTTGTYSLQITDANNCSTADTVNITFSPIPFFSLGVDTNLCPNSSITLRVPTNNNPQVLWSTNATTDSIVVTTPNTYSATITVNNCSYTDSIDITPAPTYTRKLRDTSLCYGQIVILDVSTIGATYLWNDGTTFPTLTADTSGIFSATVSISGCDFLDSSVVSLDSVPQSPNLQDTTVCEDAILTLDATTNANSYLWSNGVTSPILTIDSGGVYIVQAVNNCGFVTDTASIIVEACAPPFIPNVFTPNGDGINDFFFINFDNVRNFKVEVFNRWGERIFVSEDPKFAWDGKYRGQLVPVGAYFYIVTSKIGIGKTFNTKGSLTIFR